MPESELKKNVKLIKKYNIPLELSMIFGWPQETLKDMWLSVEKIDSLKPAQVQSHLLYPYPETEILKFCIELGFIDDDRLLQIYKGEGSSLGESLLKHSYKDHAYVISLNLECLR